LSFAHPLLPLPLLLLPLLPPESLPLLLVGERLAVRGYREDDGVLADPKAQWNLSAANA